MSRLLTILLLIAFCTLSAPAQTPVRENTTAGTAAAGQWMRVDTPRESLFVLDSNDDNGTVHALVRDGHVYVTVNRPMDVKIFTILGQPVSSVHASQSGTLRLRLPLRGVYILKAGESTRRLSF